MISADEISSWNYTNSGIINLTVTDVNNSNIRNIGNFIRTYCSADVNLTIESKGLTEIPGNVGTTKGTFEDCTKLKSINIPAGVTSLGSKAFNSCIGLTTVTIPSGVTTIGQSCFYMGIAGTILQSISIPASVTTIGAEAFAYTLNVTDINYGGTKSDWDTIIYTIDGNAFNYAFRDEGDSVVIHCSNGDCDIIGEDV